jgi:hypothetical protein
MAELRRLRRFSRFRRFVREVWVRNQVELDRKRPTQLLGRNPFPVESNVIVLAKGHHGMCSQEEYDTAHEGDYSGTKVRVGFSVGQRLSRLPSFE